MDSWRQIEKPIIPLMVHSDAELPFRLELREPINLADTFDAGIARLREHVRWRATPEGLLHTTNERLKDARRDLADPSLANKVRIKEEIAELQQQNSRPSKPPSTILRRRKSGPRRTSSAASSGCATRSAYCIEGAAPLYQPPSAYRADVLQDRHVETGLIGDFLKDDALRLLTVVGRAGIGKTAMVAVCLSLRD